MRYRTNRRLREVDPEQRQIDIERQIAVPADVNVLKTLYELNEFDMSNPCGCGNSAVCSDSDVGGEPRVAESNKRIRRGGCGVPAGTLDSDSSVARPTHPQMAQQLTLATLRPVLERSSGRLEDPPGAPNPSGTACYRYSANRWS